MAERTHTASVPPPTHHSFAPARRVMQMHQCKAKNVTCMHQYAMLYTSAQSSGVAAATAAWPQLVRHGPRQLLPRQPQLLRLRLRLGLVGVGGAGFGYLARARRWGGGGGGGGAVAFFRRGVSWGPAPRVGACACTKPHGTSARRNERAPDPAAALVGLQNDILTSLRPDSPQASGWQDACCAPLVTALGERHG